MLSSTQSSGRSRDLKWFIKINLNHMWFLFLIVAIAAIWLICLFPWLIIVAIVLFGFAVIADGN